jgi:regulator of protease activity HflC (stomatin/prohibitin superfamily)
MGIDTLATLIAIGAFFVGFIGIVMVVASASRGTPVRQGVLLAIVGILVGVVFLIVSVGLLVVGPTERAVIFNNLTGGLEPPREPGISIVVPGVQVPTIYRVSRQEYTMSSISGEGTRGAADDAIVARSIDGQEVFVDLTIIFTIDPENVNTVHANWSDASQGYLEGLIRPTVRSIVRDVIATAEAEQIFGSSRTEIQSQIEEQTTEALGEEGFTVIDVLLRSINFSPDFINAIEQRQVAELERDRASIEAERVRIEAQGRAEATIEEARGEAESIRIRAEADAEALRLVSEQIAANPNLIQYIYVTELTDNVNVALVPSSSPFLFDASTFIESDPNFTPPAVPTREPSPEPETETDTESDG